MENLLSALQQPHPAPVPGDVRSEEAEWDEAFLRVESYLHAHRINGRVAVNRLATQLIDEARRQAPEHEGIRPVTLAMGMLYDAMERWYGGVFRKDEPSGETLRGRGRLALVLTHSDSGWPQQFLVSDQVQEQLAASLRTAQLYSGPEVRLTNMAPEPLEFSINPDGKESSPSLRGRGLVQAAGLWLLIIGAMGAAWAASH